MNFLPEVCLEPRNNRLDFGDDPNYNPDYDTDLIRISQMCMKFLPELCLEPRTNPLDCGNDPDYYPGSRLS